MITYQDLEKKQIIFVFGNNDEKLKIHNENLIVIDSNNLTKLKISCYKLFLVNIIGNCSLTSVLISKAKKYGFFICLYSVGFHLVTVIGANKDGNTILKKKQYLINDLNISKSIVKNKIHSELSTLSKIRQKNEDSEEAISLLRKYFNTIDKTNALTELLSYEGLAAKIYFKQIFNNIEWKGRKPRLKSDIVNCLLDIGYTILFNYIDALLCSFGFDTYCGFYHKQFYMRKSLTCDLVEPFRVLIDYEIRKAYNLHIINDQDFNIINNQYSVKPKEKSKYIQILMKPIVNNDVIIYKYVQAIYRALMRNEVNRVIMPLVIEGKIEYDFGKL